MPITRNYSYLVEITSSQFFNIEMQVHLTYKDDFFSDDDNESLSSAVISQAAVPGWQLT